LTSQANNAQRRWDALVVPELVRLDSEVARHEVAVQQLSAVVQRRRAASEEGVRRRWDVERTSGLLDRVLSAYRDKIDGVAQPAGTRPAVHAALANLHPSPTYGPAPDADRGPSL
jgi:hypothetical protein